MSMWGKVREVMDKKLAELMGKKAEVEIYFGYESSRGLPTRIDIGELIFAGAFENIMSIYGTKQIVLLSPNNVDCVIVRIKE